MNAVPAMTTDSARTIATCFALAAFAVAIFAGVSAGVDAAQILLRAVLSMVVCYPVGMLAGMACEGVIRAHASANSIATTGESVESVPANISSAPTSGQSAARSEAPEATRSRAAA